MLFLKCQAQNCHIYLREDRLASIQNLFNGDPSCRFEKIAFQHVMTGLTRATRDCCFPKAYANKQKAVNKVLYCHVNLSHSLHSNDAAI